MPALTPKTLIGTSVLLLAISGVFGFLNTQKVKSLRDAAVLATAARDDVQRRRDAEQKQLKEHQTTATAATAKLSQNENRVAKAEADLVQMQTEKSDLQAKLQAAQADVTRLQGEVDQTTTKSGENPGAPSAQELQAQLDESRKQLEGAERENALLVEKMRGAQERTAPVEEEKKRRVVSNRPGVRGTVLAVNEAYNFVVLNLGGRQGVEPNTEMLIFRDGTLIGKLRVSSVEPSTAIGDIIGSSLARGVQVQPGDIVVYAGTNS